MVVGAGVCVQPMPPARSPRLPLFSSSHLSQVAVRILYAGVNGGCETFRVRAGLEPHTPFARADAGSIIPLGAEGVGVVAAVGSSVSSLKPGDAVAVSGAGSFAEFVRAPSSACTRLPAATPAAAAATLSGVTAAVALDVTAGGVRAGDTVCVTAAAGGTGHLAAQWAAAAGARVVAVVGSAEKAALITRLLAKWPDAGHAVVDRSTVAPSDLPAALAAAAGPSGVDVAYEGVGGPLRAAVLETLADGGRMVCVGYVSAYPHSGDDAATRSTTPSAPSLPPDRDLFWGRARLDLPGGRVVHGDAWGGADARAVARARKKVLAAVAAGDVEAVIDQPMHVGLERADDAVDRLLSGASMGKVVLDVAGGARG